MSISYSKKSVPYDFGTEGSRIWVSCVEYPGEYGSGMTLLKCEKYMDFYISKRGKDISGISLDMINREGFNGTKTLALVGGSSLGLEAICGVNKALLKDNDYKYFDRTPGVCCYTTNMIFGPKSSKGFIAPDMKLGQFAFDTLSNDPIPIGQVGVGKNSAVAKMDKDWRKHYVNAGQGVHFIKEGRFRILAIVNLNSIGLVHDNGKLLHPYKKYTYLSDIPHIDEINELLKGVSDEHPKNTTISMVITNIKLDESEREYYGEKLHDVIQSMIYPYGTLYDGDTMFLASTGTYNLNSDELVEKFLGDEGVFMKKGSECLRNAIKSVFI